MNVTREVILDLLPVYLSGEASPATRALVEEFVKQDSELAQRIRLQWAENFAKVAPSALPDSVPENRGRTAKALRHDQPDACAPGSLLQTDDKLHG